MGKKGWISVIVPVYNVEKYIDRCLDSLVNQTYKDLEIIIVNDCSPDNCEMIIKDYEKKYDNVIYIKNSNNKGLSFSRNVGLKRASGDYIGFIDSDDYVSCNYFESLINTMEKENADVVVCDMNIVNEFDATTNRCICGSKSNKKNNFINNGLAASACNKLFKRENIEKYKFEEGKINEDISVVIPTMVHANKVAYNDEVFYNYIQRENSIQNSYISDKRFDIFYGVKQALERINDDDNFSEYKEAIIYHQLIIFLIYFLPKEPSILRLSKLFKKFYALSKGYNIENNKYLKELLQNQGRKRKICLLILFKLNRLKLYFFASVLVQVYKRLKKLFSKSILKKN